MSQLVITSCEYTHVIQDEMTGLLNTQEELKKGNQKITKMMEDMEKKKVVPVVPVHESSKALSSVIRKKGQLYTKILSLSFL